MWLGGCGPAPGQPFSLPGHSSQLGPAEPYKSPSVFGGKKKQKLAPWSCSSSLSWLEFTASFDVYQYITSRCSCQDHVLVKVIYHPPKAYSKQLHTTCRSRKIRDQHRWQEPSQRGPRSPLDILLTNTGLPLSNCVYRAAFEQLRMSGNASKKVCDSRIIRGWLSELGKPGSHNHSQP